MSAREVEQAGGVVYRLGPDGLEFLLVRAKKDPSHWIFPKGHIEKGETPAIAAVREVEEEAGVTGRVIKELKPSLRFISGREPVNVRYYLIEANDASKLAEREIKWLPPADAARTITHDDAKRLLIAAARDINEETPRDRAREQGGNDPDH
jgi:8-oxo-dGTP pyrophosphatase MutT (NUDIX family)